MSSEGGLRPLIDNITKLEINTIIKDNMTARKMPDPANAILDIAHMYAWKLVSLNVPVGKWLEAKPDQDIRPNDPQAGPQATTYEADLKTLAKRDKDELAGWLRDDQPAFDPGDLTIHVHTFLCLRWAASAVVRHADLGASDRVIVERIRKNCDQLKNMLWRLRAEPQFAKIAGASRASLNAFEATATVETEAYWERELLRLGADDRTTLRKIWEIGVEEVAAQTTIDLDGDTITRIGRKYATPAQAHVLEIHKMGIETAVGYWRGLIEAVGSFIVNLADLALGGRK
ncbi:MAG: hypothetical protein MI920_21585 [Kiloniellales bacterium]|nr:hypothetical protein [Kiloniellales bacterium]